jgi:hypothetical protein
MIDLTPPTSSALKKTDSKDTEPSFLCLYCGQKKVRLQGR